MTDLTGKVALVTGSSSGIGEATARKLAAAGARVVVNSSTSVDAGEAVSASLPTESFYHQADISSNEECHSLLESCIGRFGQLDILVNNAGWTTSVPHDDLEALTDEIFVKTFEINVFGTWWLTKAAIPYLAKADDGNVVNVTSVAGVRPMGSSIAYSMAKAALNQMTVLLAKSMGPARVNAVAPGLVATPWTEDWDDLHAVIAERAPLHRSATPDEIADAVIALVTSTYVTGAVLVVDGGLSQVM